MTIADHLTTFADKNVVDWEPGTRFDPATQAVRLSVGWDAAEEGKQWVDFFTAFLDTPAAARTTALIVGDWGQTGGGSESGPVVEALVSQRNRLPALKALFLGDIIMEESEISWITQSDMGPLFPAFPTLREFWVRGGNSLKFGALRHQALQKLVVQTGGLDADVVRQILGSSLPELTHLELWLGTDNYGANTTIADLKPLMENNPFPKLKFLGLMNSDIGDAIAKTIVAAPILHQIETLDLSMGTLGDDGALALAGSPAIAALKHLNLAHNYMSDKVLAALKAKLKSLDASEQEEPDDWGNGEQHRYVSVGE
jgi:hypothetical protein